MLQGGKFFGKKKQKEEGTRGDPEHQESGGGVGRLGF